MIQPNAGYQWFNISGTAAGTAVITNKQATLAAVYIPANNTGTVTFYDSATGTAAKSIAFANTVGSIPTNIWLNINFSNGIAYTVGGTTSVVAIWN